MSNSFNSLGSVRFTPAIISILLLLSNCISPYEPDIQGTSGLLVVDGSIIKGRENQVIIISKTAPISKPEYLPVEKCNVKVLDINGNEFVFNEESPGKYVAKIDDASLNYDMQYKLVFTTSTGDEYESEYQWLLKTPQVDSIYGIKENRYSSVTGYESIKGIQFYVDLDAPEDASKYYRWVVEETWEIMLENDIWAEYDGSSIKLFNRRDSLQHCWLNKDVTGLYAASTVNLSENRIKKIPLHFLLSSSPKLSFKYCATVKQYALNADAYEYWYQKERELNESGNIYSNQPSQPKSNIYNINNPEEKVMGFFWASSSQIKRVFESSHQPAFYQTNCSAIGIYCESNDFNVISASIYRSLEFFADRLPPTPIYISLKYNTNYTIQLKPECVDCRTLAVGSDAQKPDFWE